MLVTVPPRLGAALVNVIVPPSATCPPPDNPDPAFTVIDGFAMRLFVTPPVAMLMVPALVIVPPVRPDPVATLLTVPLPPAPGKVCPVAKVIWPLLATAGPVSAGVAPPEPKRRFNLPEGFAVLLPVGSACQRKS